MMNILEFVSDVSRIKHYIQNANQCNNQKMSTFSFDPANEYLYTIHTAYKADLKFAFEVRVKT